MRQDLPHLLVPSRRGGVDGKCFIVSQMSAFQEMSVSKAPEYTMAHLQMQKNALALLYELQLTKFQALGE